MRRLRTGGWLAAALLLLAAPLALADGEFAGSGECATCHEEISAAWPATAHALAPGWDEERGCESCHGPAAAHVEEGGSLETIRRPAALPAPESNGICLSCHDRQARHEASGLALHARGGVACTDCHDPHARGASQLRQPVPELCAGCHQAQAAQFDLPRSHPVKDCSACHSPHASRSLRGGGVRPEESCTGCHFEKEGPFVYEHDVIRVEGCAACHEVHGSPNRHLLTSQTQVNLCYQCHSGAVTPTWHSAPRFLEEKCSACHTAIHGSNTNPFFLEE